MKNYTIFSLFNIFVALGFLLGILLGSIIFVY